MNIDIFVSYSLIIVGILGIGFLFLTQKPLRKSRYLQLVNAFGGAFLLAICFLHLIPHIYNSSDLHIHEAIDEHHCHSTAINMGLFVLLGFLIQLSLEYLTKGVEHGHLHVQQSANNTPQANIIGLMIGLCLHAFMEGMPLVQRNGDVHFELVMGIIIHNIPITLILCSLFINKGYSRQKSLLLLVVFALMSPIGSLVSRYLFSGFANFENIVMAIVVGILLHVSVSILFQDEKDKKMSVLWLISILLAFCLALLISFSVH